MILPVYTFETSLFTVEVWPLPGARRWHFQWFVEYGRDCHEHGLAETADDAACRALDRARELVLESQAALTDEELPP